MVDSALWLGSLSRGLAADLPGYYTADTDIQFYYATDTATLYMASKPATENAAPDWEQFVSITDGVLDLSSLPTSDPGVAGQAYSNSGVVTISAG